MSIRTLTAAAALVAATAGLPASAAAGSSRPGAVFAVEGFVPLLCRVTLSDPAGASPDGVTRVEADAFCNAPRGYRIVLSHAGDLPGAAVMRDGVRVPLSASGETVLTDTDAPGLRRLALALDRGDRPERFTALSIRIEAKA